jgi:CDP-diacylglycerol--serine O-phosphatidyltransferase
MRIIGDHDNQHLPPDPHADRPRRLHARRLKAVSVLPSMATLGNLLFGMGALYMCLLSFGAGGTDLAITTFSSERWEKWFPTYLAIGCYLVVIAAFFDVLDGRLARLTRRTSEFGAQLDTLADVVSFGVAPALMVLCVARPLLPTADLTEAARLWWRVQWIMASSFACCAALRLARFNVENVEDESAHMRFKGLPSPGGAAVIIGLVLVHEDIIRVSGVAWASEILSRVLPVVAVLTGLLMVSRLPYVHMLNTVARKRRPFSHVVAMVFLLLAGAVIKPQLTVAIVALAYALSGPAVAAWRRFHGRTDIETSPAAADSTSSEKRAG